MREGTPQEFWLPIPGLEGCYEVSNLGGVRSLDRWVERPQNRAWTRGQLLRPNQRGSYLRVSPQGIGRYVHELVATTFHGPRPPGMEVRHLDGNSLNNAAFNVQWGTHAQNQNDQVLHGTHPHARKKTCDFGHELVAPNIFPGLSQSRGWRVCVSCSRASNAVRRAGLRGVVVDHRIEADRRYAILMATGDAFGTCPDCGARGTRRGPFRNQMSLQLHRRRAHASTAA